MTRLPKVLALVAVLAVVGCGAAAVDESQVEEKVKKALGEKVGREPESIDCPDDLPAEVGAALRCTLTDSGLTYGVTVNVTKVDGSDVLFDIAVDQKPTTTGATTAK